MTTAANLAALGSNTNSSGQVATAGVQDAAITNAKLVNGYPNQDIVSPVNLGVTNMGSANTYYNLGSISIPSAGVWRIWSSMRWGSQSANCFIRCQLSSTTGNGGVFVYPRMQFENIQASSGNMNLECAAEWIVTFGTGITYPYTVYFGAFEGNSGGTVFLQNDSNGYNQLGAIKIASTTSSASTPAQVGY